jgi:hypothetical protein
MYEPWPDREFPPTWRVCLAFLLAPGAAALLMAIAMPAYDGLTHLSERVWRTAQTNALLGAYPTAVLFGLPAYFMLRRHFSARPLACVIAGSVVAALPWGLLIAAGSGASEASINGHATVLNGHTTAYGWLKHAEFILTIALFGGVGGFVFWAVAAAGYTPKRPPTERQTSAEV